jgi:hypothetical protein
MNKRIIIFEVDDQDKYFDSIYFRSEELAKERLKYRRDHEYRKNDKLFIFNITRLPKELTTIWKGSSYAGWEYPIEFQYHVAETYLLPYLIEDTECKHEYEKMCDADTLYYKCKKCQWLSHITPTSMADVEQQTDYVPNWDVRNKCIHDFVPYIDGEFLKGKKCTKCRMTEDEYLRQRQEVSY